MSVAAPVSEPRTVRPRPGLRGMLMLVVGGQLLAGVLVGIVWRAWSPHTLGFVLAGAGGKSVVIPDESESQVAGDGRFVLLCMAVGLVAALGAWQLRRVRGALTLLALVGGALLGSLVARQVGMALATGHSTGAVNSTIRLPLGLHARALLTAQAMVAAAVYAALSGLSSHDELGSEPAVGADAAAGESRALGDRSAPAEDSVTGEGSVRP